MSDIFEEVKLRCEEAGIGYEEVLGEWSVLEEVEGEQKIVKYSDEPEIGPVWVLRIDIPRGRGTFPVYVQGVPYAEWLLSEPFEDFKKLKGYEASWSLKHRVIECNLVPCDPRRAALSLSKSRYTSPGSQAASGIEERVVFGTSAPYSVSIGECSNVHAILGNNVVEGGLSVEAEDQLGNDPGVRVKRSLTLRIEGIEANTHDDAVEVLERVADSFCFQLDLALNRALMLQRELLPEEHIPTTKQLERPPTSTTLRFRYDHESMSLYWYAKTAAAMPLFQFLAYYQVLEFYFPVYSKMEAHNTLRNLLKDPTFDPSRSTDIERLLRVSQTGTGGRGFGNEASQLEATIHHCVTADDLRSFLISEDENRYKFFTSDNAKKLTRARVPVREESTDHRGSVAKRVYEIRNRIVHTKSGQEDQGPLFPFDSETKYLKYDIELVEFLARKVLIASGRPLQA